MATKPLQPRAPQSGARILIVDDDTDALAILKLSLKPAGHNVIEAENGVQGLERCRDELPDLIISDIMMPIMNGIQFAQAVRAEFPETFIPMLMVTALSEIDEKVEGLDAGADDYITKPFDFNELQARVRALLRVKALTEQLKQRNSELAHLNWELSQTQEELIRKERELVAMQLAGAAAHNLGQPLTAIVLNCRLLERSIDSLQFPGASHAIQAIETECETIKSVLAKLRAIDANRTEEYLGSTTILNIDLGHSK